MDGYGGCSEDGIAETSYRCTTASTFASRSSCCTMQQLPRRYARHHGLFRGKLLQSTAIAVVRGTWCVFRSINSHVAERCMDGSTAALPAWLDSSSELLMRSRDEIFDVKRSMTWYKDEIGRRLDAVLDSNDVDLGALVMEPVLQGAGGMHMIDPAFQRALMDKCRRRKIPIVLDEVFTGLWILRELSGAYLLGVEPDVAAYIKLLTGRIVPLSVTLATEDVCRSFDGASKREALLHGHSYTARAIGCAAAVESLRLYDERLRRNGNNKCHWDEGCAREISCMNEVKWVVVIGTVLAVELKGAQGGYTATGAKKVVRHLLNERFFARPLGNVVHIMCTPLSNALVYQNLMEKLLTVLQEMRLNADEGTGWYTWMRYF